MLAQKLQVIQLLEFIKKNKMANLSNINGKFVVEQTTGYVGVGTTDPNYPIEVLNASAEIALNASGASIYRLRSTSGDSFMITKNGVGDRLVIDGSGNSTFAGTVTAAQYYKSSTAYNVIGTGSSGEVILRPTAWNLSTAQSSFSTTLATIGTDATFAGNIFLPTASSYIKFGGYSYIGEDLTEQDSLTIASDSTESIYFAHYNQGTSTYTTTVQIDPSGNVMLDVNNWLQGHVTVGGGTQNLIRSRAMGYPGYYGCQIGQETNHIALFIDPNSVAGGAFSGNVNELMLPNKVIFQQANAVTNPTDWLNGQSITLDNGKVGIGTTSPFSAAKLDVNGNIYAKAAAATIDVVAYNTTSGLTDADLHLAATSSGEGQVRMYGNYPLTFYTNNAERMRIKSDGNILIADTRQIQFYNTDQYIRASSTNDLEIVAGDDINYRSNFSRFFSGSAEHARLTGVGGTSWVVNGSATHLFGVGLTNPSTKLTVKDSQDSSLYSGLKVERSANTTGAYLNVVGGALNLNTDSSMPLKFRILNSSMQTINTDGGRAYAANASGLNMKEYGYNFTAANGVTVDLIANTSAHSDIAMVQISITAYHSSRTFFAGMGTFGGYGFHLTGAGNGLGNGGLTSTITASGKRKLQWYNGSGYNAVVRLYIQVRTESGITVLNGTLSNL